MNPLLKKMQLKDMERPILVLGAPDSYQDEIATFEMPVHIEKEEESYGFIQVFGTSLEAIKNLSQSVLDVFDYDGLLWLCYPKKSSKKYKGSDCDRMSVANLLGEFGYEPVRQVAVDDDWSALRLRPVEEIKSMTRSFAASEKGKKRIEKNK